MFYSLMQLANISSKRLRMQRALTQRKGKRGRQGTRAMQKSLVYPFLLCVCGCLLHSSLLEMESQRAQQTVKSNISSYDPLRLKKKFRSPFPIWKMGVKQNLACACMTYCPSQFIFFLFLSFFLWLKIQEIHMAQICSYLHMPMCAVGHVCVMGVPCA